MQMLLSPLWIFLTSWIGAGVALGPPPPPREIQLVAEESDIEVQWDQSGLETRRAALGYQVQYTKQGNDGEWQTLQQPQTIHIVDVRVDEHFTPSRSLSLRDRPRVSDGWFTLELSFTPAPHQLDGPLPLRVTSGHIPWDATWQSIRDAIENALASSNHKHFKNGKVEAVRFLTPGMEDVSVSLKEETITALWTGEGDQVRVAPYARGLVDPFFCSSARSGTCTVRIPSAEPGEEYAVRVRLLNSDGWGEYSTPSLLRLPRRDPPAMLQAPFFLSSQGASLTLGLKSPPEGAPTNYTLELQSELEMSGEWEALDIPVREAGYDMWLVSVSLGSLATSTAYRFRARAINERGPGPWSMPSEVLKTVATTLPTLAAPAVDLGSISDNSLVVRWAPWSESALTTAAHQLQHQVVGSMDWVQAEIEGRQLHAAHVVGLEPSTEYSFRHRLTGPNEEGLWSAASISARTKESNLARLFESAQSVPEDHTAEASNVAVPAVLSIDHRSCHIGWQAGAELLNGETTAIEVEMADRADSDEYSLMGTVARDLSVPLQQQQYEFYLAPLEPSTAYRVRLRAIYARGKSAYGAPLVLRTKATPVSTWEMITPKRVLSAQGKGGGLDDPTTAFVDRHQTVINADPAEELLPMPDPRHGHTAVEVSSSVFMFGGLSEGHQCSEAVTDTIGFGYDSTGVQVDRCRRGADSYSNELWRYHAVTKRWEHLLVDGARPAGRQGHSASVLNNQQMVIMGGRNSETSNPSPLLGFDALWSIDLDPRTSVTYTFPTPETISAGAKLRSTMTVEDSDGMCISSLDAVRVSVDHGCPQLLNIALVAAGPRAERANYLPQGRQHSSHLWPTAEHMEEGCVAMDGNLDLHPPPSSYDGIFMNGEWTLEVYDRGARDHMTGGSLTSWSIDVTLRPCDYTSSLAWEQHAATGDVPASRANYMQAVVDQSIYVTGGRAVGSPADLPYAVDGDLYRLDTETWTWVKLAAASAGIRTPGFFGSSFVLNEAGLVGLGGIAPRDTLRSAPYYATLLDMRFRKWRVIPLMEHSPAPAARWGSSAASLSYSAALYGGDSFEGPAVFLMGGRDPSKAQSDLWVFWLRGFQPEGPSQEQFCLHRTQPGTTLDDTWETACAGATALSSCTFQDVLLRAWCTGQFQAIGSFLGVADVKVFNNE